MTGEITKELNMLRRGGGGGGDDGGDGHHRHQQLHHHKLEAGVAEINNSLCNAMLGIVLSDEALRFRSTSIYSCILIFKFQRFN